MSGIALRTAQAYSLYRGRGNSKNHVSIMQLVVNITTFSKHSKIL